MEEEERNPYIELRRGMDTYRTSDEWYPHGRAWHHQIKNAPDGVLVSVHIRGRRFRVTAPKPWGRRLGGEFFSIKDAIEAAESVALKDAEKAA